MQAKRRDLWVKYRKQRTWLLSKTFKMLLLQKIVLYNNWVFHTKTSKYNMFLHFFLRYPKVASYGQLLKMNSKTKVWTIQHKGYKLCMIATNVTFFEKIISISTNSSTSHPGTLMRLKKPICHVIILWAVSSIEWTPVICSNSFRSNPNWLLLF
jgi:hypothetical protein